MKTQILKLGLFCLMLVLMGAGCQDDEKNISILKDCNLDDEVKTLIRENGIIWYDSLSQQYAVFTGIDGSYDSQNVGITCNLPDSFQKEGLKISFDGKYFNCEEFVSNIPGQTYYYLELTEIKIFEK